MGEELYRDSLELMEVDALTLRDRRNSLASKF